MTRTITLMIAFIQIVNYAICQQFLYVETKLGGCYEPLPMAYYVELPDSVNLQTLLENDSLLVNFLNTSSKIYASVDMIYFLRDSTITEEMEDKFILDYQQFRKNYTFVRNENWGNFHIKIALVEHELIKYSPVKWTHPENAELYDYKDNRIQISISEKRNFNYAYHIE